MSNFLNSGFTNLNSLTNFDADEIRTNTLYVNGILIEPNSNVFDVITCTQLICQNDISANTIHAVTSIQDVPVSKFAFFKNVTSDIQDQFNSIANTYCLQSNYLTLKSQADNSTLNLTGISYSTDFGGYTIVLNNMYINGQFFISGFGPLLDVTNILLNLPTTYVSISSLATTLSNYCLQSDYLTLKSQADVTTILLTGASYSSAYGGYLNFENNIHVYGALYLGPDNNLINVNDTLYNLPNNYCSQSNYLALKNITDSLTALLVNIEHISGFGLNFYEGINVFGPMLVTVNGNYLNVGSILNGLSSNYCSQSNYLALKSQSDANSTLIATNTASIAGLVIASASQQAQITGLAATVGGVQAGLFDAQQDITTLQENTEYITVGGILTRYTQFAGDGIKMMNGVGYSVIINVNGESQWYGLMTLADGLEVTNAIIADRITLTEEIYNTGITTLANTSINGTLGVTGVSTLYNTNINGTLGVTGTSILSTTTLPNGNLTISNGTLFVNGASTLNATNLASGNLTITTGKLEILGGAGLVNYINNDTIFNGNMFGNNNLTITNNLNALNINSDNLNFADSLGGHAMLIGTNGGSISAGNTITIGNAYSVTYLGGIVAFTGAVFNMTNLINQVGF